MVDGLFLTTTRLGHPLILQRTWDIFISSRGLIIELETLNAGEHFNCKEGTVRLEWHNQLPTCADRIHPCFPCLGAWWRM